MIGQEDRHIEEDVARLQVMIEQIKVELHTLHKKIEELSARRFPWLPLVGVIAPITTVVIGVSLQNVIQLNLTAERVAQIQKQLEKKSTSYDAFNEELGRHTAELEKMRLRLESLEKTKK